jgi:hypothetical protein
MKRMVVISGMLVILGALMLGGCAGTDTEAQSAPPAPHQSAADSARDVEAHIAALHDQLQITPAEEAQWQVVAQCMRDNAATLTALRQARVAQAPTMSALDDVRSYAQIAEAHAAGIQKFAPAFTTLYDQMPPAQQKLVDSVFRSRIQEKAAAQPTSPNRG